jgi:hypothetical protein
MTKTKLNHDFFAVRKAEGLKIDPNVAEVAGGMATPWTRTEFATCPKGKGRLSGYVSRGIRKATSGWSLPASAPLFFSRRIRR